MMRRLRVSAASPHVATRTRVTGFSLFVHESQKEHKVLKSENIRQGRQNMQIMSGMWKELTSRRRELYNERARQRNSLLLSDPMKKNNNFNLIMRLFGAEKILQNAGDEAFIAYIAKSTMRAMKTQDTRRLRAKLQVKGNFDPKKHSMQKVTSAFKRFSNPHMKFFDSFTEMQRSVAPTRQAAFAAISKLVSLSNVTASGEEYVVNNFATLSTEETHLFAPISDIEAPFFEIFCATRCGALDYKHFNILQLFMAFRGIDVKAAQNPPRERLYRSLLGTDRSHDGAYFRARRCLERLETARSSDCGMYIAKRIPDGARVSPSAYGIEADWDDVSVATMLAETRHAQSVYDDILVRAAVLRSEEGNAQLDRYLIRLDKEAEETNAVHTTSQSTRRALAKDAVEETEEAPDVEEEEVEVQKKKVVAAKTKRAKAAASRSAHVETPIKTAKTRRDSKQSSPVTAAVSVSDLSTGPARRRSAPPRATKKKAVERAHLADNVAGGEEVAEDVDVVRAEQTMTHKLVTPPPKSLSARTSAKKATTSSSSAAHAAQDAFDVESFLAADEAEGYDVGDTEDAMVEGERDDVSAEAAAVAPTSKATKERRGTARSHLTDPASMLPAKARVQKLITKHASERRVVRPSTASQPSPYVPPGRNASFTESIRALLSSSV